ncbi:MAG: hypothetical protein HY238_23415 [Acidobacteria bacterium]|nr:hypothetical protein [Acidobacteriota bacterium]
MLLISGCSGKQDRTASKEEPQVPLRLSQLSAYQNEVFPLANGNAYLVSLIDRQVFLLSKNRARRIHGIELDGIEATVYPLPDGAAYLVSSSGENLRLYHLLADKATPVDEPRSVDKPRLRRSDFANRGRGGRWISLWGVSR